MATTNILTAQPDDLAADYFVLTDKILQLLTTPSLRSNTIARGKPKVVGAASYIWTIGAGLKGTSRAHIEKLHANGIGWRAIYEAGAGDSDEGAVKGTIAAKKALGFLTAIAADYPQGLTITACSDTDTTSKDLQANLDFHAAFAQVLKEDGRWKASVYGDSTLGAKIPLTTPITYPGASAWSMDFFTAINGVNRGNAKAITAAVKARGLRIPDALQQGNGAGGLVDWLFLYTSNVQFWLPGAGDPVGPPRPPHSAVLTFLPLKVGSTGNNVAWCQTILKHLCGRPQLSVDGIFGNQTSTAVLDFQKYFGFKQTGIVDTVETWPMFLYIVQKTPT